MQIHIQFNQMVSQSLAKELTLPNQALSDNEKLMVNKHQYAKLKRASIKFKLI